MPGREVLRVENLVKHFPTHSGLVRAVDGVSLTLAEGETLGLVGESGCGKSTLARAMVRLLEPTAGRVLFDGRDLTAAGRRELQELRRELQIVFQDPYASLNPRMRVGEIVSQPLRAQRRYRQAGGIRWIGELFELVGLDPDQRDRFPHEFSGGQRQRVGIARALALSPRVIVLDEPVSALDVSIRAQIVNLLARLQRELGVAYVFIAHDLAVVRQLAHRVAVMYLGRVVETGTRDAVYHHATHPYTQALLSAVPVPDPEGRGQRRRIVLAGETVNSLNPPSGCRFRTRCWKAEDRCTQQEPALVDRLGHPSACHFPDAAAPVPQDRGADLVVAVGFMSPNAGPSAATTGAAPSGLGTRHPDRLGRLRAVSRSRSHPAGVRGWRSRHERMLVRLLRRAGGSRPSGTRRRVWWGWLANLVGRAGWNRDRRKGYRG